MKGNDTQETYKSDEDMKNNRLFTTICLMAAILFTACTQDELAEQGTALPSGEYPLQIGSVTITAESSEEPWTRVAENETDGMGSHWTGGEEFYVKFEGSDEVGIYKITDAATGAVVPVKSIYWKNTQPANIIAWYAKPQLRLGLRAAGHGRQRKLRHPGVLAVHPPAGQGARGDQGHSRCTAYCCN